jgi:hypothetical protein
MKLLVIASSLDLRSPYSCTPAWWQLLKGLYECGVEVVATPYQGAAVETLWWRGYPNPCERAGHAAAALKKLVHPPRRDRIAPQEGEVPESATDRAFRSIAQAWVFPRWRAHIDRIFERERSFDAVLILTVPPNHIRGLGRHITERYAVPVYFYDGDVPASLPRFAGFGTGFRIYQGADISEYTAVISQSRGGAPDLKNLGAREVHVLYWGADPEVFAPVAVEQDTDIFFYGHGMEYREGWIRAMVEEAARLLPHRQFAVRGRDLAVRGDNIKHLPYLSFSQLREYCCRSRINLNITRAAHASVEASATSRPFELGAMGCCIVSNPVAGLQDWYEPGREVKVVSSAEEAAQVYEALLSLPEGREVIARGARTRTLDEHTFRHRAQQLCRILAGDAAPEVP